MSLLLTLQEACLRVLPEEDKQLLKSYPEKHPLRILVEEGWVECIPRSQGVLGKCGKHFGNQVNRIQDGSYEFPYTGNPILVYRRIFFEGYEQSVIIYESCETCLRRIEMGEICSGEEEWMGDENTKKLLSFKDWVKLIRETGNECVVVHPGVPFNHA